MAHCRWQRPVTVIKVPGNAAITAITSRQLLTELLDADPPVPTRLFAETKDTIAISLECQHKDCAFLEPLSLATNFQESIRTGAQALGVQLQNYEDVPLATRMRGSIVPADLHKPTWLGNLLDTHIRACAREWRLPYAFLKHHPIGRRLCVLIEKGLIQALCTLQTDHFQTCGFLHPTACLEALTTWQPTEVLALVIYADAKTQWGAKEIKAGKVWAELYELKNGDTLVLKGPAGQCCSHILFGMKGEEVVCLRHLFEVQQ